MNTARSYHISRRDIVVTIICMVAVASVAWGQQASGFPPFNTFDKSQFDTVNLANLNVHFEIPILHKAGRGMPFSYDLIYDSTIFVGVPGPPAGFERQGNWGWNPSGAAAIMGYVIFAALNCPSNSNATNYANWAFVDRSGTSHPFPTSFLVSTDGTCGPAQASATSSDGSGYSITVNNNGPSLVSLVDAAGDTLVVPLGGAWGTVGTVSVGHLGSSITDPNGNVISTDQQSGQIFTDTLGTTALSMSTTVDGNGNITSATYTYPAPNSGQSSVVVNYKLYPAVQTAFGCPNTGEVHFFGFPVPFSGVPLVDNIVMPDGGKYTFQYELTPGNPQPAGSVTGRLTAVTLPTGGSITYQYTGANGGINCTDGTTMGLTRTTPDGTYTYTRSANGTTTTTTATDPKQNQTVVTVQNGFESQRQIYQGTASPSTLLTTTVTCYNIASGSPPSTNCPTPTVPVTRVSTLVELPDAAHTTTVTSATDMFFNSAGLPTEMDEYDNGSGTTPGALSRKSTVSYTSVGNILNKPSAVTIFDGSGNQIAQSTYGYDGRGNSTSFTRTGLNATTISRSTTYNANGTVNTSTDFNSNQTSYVYGAGSCNGSFATTINEPASLVRSATWDCNGGVMTSATDENGKTTSYTYGDAHYWRPTQISYPDGGQVTYSYNSAVSPWNVTQSTKITSTQTLSSNTVYDTLGRISQQQITSDPAGTTTVDTAYDGVGLVKSISNPHRTGSNPTDGTTQYAYDGMGRLTIQTQPDGNTIQSSYSANCVTVTDEAGKQRESCADGLGRTARVLEPDSTNTLTWETDYTYDVFNNLISVTQKGGSTDSTQWRTRTFTYDGFSRLTQSVTPEAGTTTYAYTTSGGALCSGDPSLECRCTDARGIVKTFAYDALNRITGKTYSDSTPTVTYAYDQTLFNGLTITNGKGRRTSMTDGSGSTGWSYDTMGRVLTRQQTMTVVTPNVTKSIGQTYNLDGSISSITYPSGRVYTYSYDNAARPVSAVDTAHNLNFVTSAQYAPPGMLISAIQGAVPAWNAVTETASYNNRLQPTQFLASSPVPLTLLNLNFSYDQGSGKNNGRVVQVANNRDSTRSVAYTYDQLNRLSSARTYLSTTWGNSYVYDPWGNLLQKNVSQGTAESLSVIVNNKNHITTPAFTYDAAGNVTWDTSNALRYDAEGRMTPVSGTTYTYDGENRRVAKSDGTVYWFDDKGKPLSVGTTSGSITRDYIFFGGKRVAFFALASGNAYFYLSDQVSSTAVISSGDGKAIQWEADYFPFGSERAVLTNKLDNHYQFTGDEFDFETSYNYALARFEVGRWGRFLSPDSYSGSMQLDDPQSLNRYSYVMNDPTNAMDPTGQDEDCLLGDCFGFDNFDPFLDFPFTINFTGFPSLGIFTPGMTLGGLGILPGENSGLPSGFNIRPPSLTDLILEELGLNPSGDNSNCDFVPNCHDMGQYSPFTNSFGNGQKPGGWFGTNYCGPGGSGPVLNQVDEACKAHDQCYDRYGFTMWSNNNPWLSNERGRALQQCNQALCDAVRKIKDQKGTSRIDYWFSNNGFYRCK